LMPAAGASKAPRGDGGRIGFPIVPTARFFGKNWKESDARGAAQFLRVL
jgi:hypothetical protein